MLGYKRLCWMNVQILWFRKQFLTTFTGIIKIVAVLATAVIYYKIRNTNYGNSYNNRFP